MSAHLRCTRCGRQPYQALHVTLTNDGVPLCDGPDCDEIALGLSAPGRRSSAVTLLAALGAGAPLARRSGATNWDRARSSRPRPNHGGHGAEARIAAAAEKRARRAAKRATPTPPERAP